MSKTSTAGRAATEPGGTSAEAPVLNHVQRRQMVIAICGLLGYQGFTSSINGIGAPWIAASFHLDQSEIAGLYAWISLSALGALALGRLADRVGRQRVLFWCMIATPLSALGAALSFNVAVFVGFDLILYACVGATLATAVVMIAEELPLDARARGQSFGGLALGLGGGLCVTVMPLLADGGYSWRWALVLAAAGIFVTPFLARRIPESHRWTHAASTGAISASRFHDVFGARYRRRTIPILMSSLLGMIAGTAATSWCYYHAVTVVGLTANAASVMMLVGGGISMLGFPLGAWFADHVGRVPTVVISGLLVATGSVFFYWGPPDQGGSPGLWLGAGFCWLMAAINASQVGGNAAATELFPTALRGTMIGWFALVGAIGAVTAQVAIAALAGPLGGLSTVVGYLALLAIPSAIVFGLSIEETRGLTLEVASRE